jgi:hypothetical protein
MRSSGHQQNPDGYDDIGARPDATTDPGADYSEIGEPDLNEDLAPPTGEQPEPMRHSIPTDVPVASLDFGTTLEEERSGESHAGRLAREEPEVWDDLDAPPSATPGEELPVLGGASAGQNPGPDAGDPAI